MKVTIVFDFPTITDPNGPEADDIVGCLTAQSVDWQEEWKLRLHAEASVYVDDVTTEE